MSPGWGDIGAGILRNQVLNGILYDYLYHLTHDMSTGKVYTEKEVIHFHSNCFNHYNVGRNGKRKFACILTFVEV